MIYVLSSLLLLSSLTNGHPVTNNVNQTHLSQSKINGYSVTSASRLNQTHSSHTNITSPLRSNFTRLANCTLKSNTTHYINSTSTKTTSLVKQSHSSSTSKIKSSTGIAHLRNTALTTGDSSWTTAAETGWPTGTETGGDFPTWLSDPTPVQTNPADSTAATSAAATTTYESSTRRKPTKSAAVTSAAATTYESSARPAPTLSTAGGDVFITFYGYDDNDNGEGQYGTAVIAYPSTRHPVAVEDIGSFDRPSSFAAAAKYFKPHEKIYVPRLKKYYVLDDGCVECEADAANGKIRIDLYIGGSTQLEGSPLISCQEANTRDQTYTEQIVRNPPNGLPVDTKYIYRNGQCHAPSY